MKRCNKCGEYKSFEEFAKNKSKRDGLQGSCRECVKVYNVNHYEKTKHIWKDSRAASRKAIIASCQEWLGKYLIEHPCVDCGNYDVRVLDFDHREDALKVNNVTYFMKVSKSKMIEEVSKCDVRCKNCHTIITYERIGGSWRDKWVVEHDG